MSLKPNPAVSDAGNPAKPEGEAGEKMLRYMNEEHTPLTLWALDIPDYGKEDRILDIGCGGGMTLKRLSKRIPEGHLFGVDYSEVSVALSKETNAKDIASGKTEIKEGTVLSLPYEDGFFDKALTVESFYFWPEPIKALSEVRRVLKDGGIFLLVSEIYERPDLTEHVRDNIRKYQMNVPGIREFEELFKKAGFSKTTVHTKGGEFWIAVEGVK